MTSAATITPSKITDYFPPSPKHDGNDELQYAESINGGTEISIKNEIDERLSTSSVIITPTSSPGKDDQGDNKQSDIKQEDVKNETTKHPVCKKALSEALINESPNEQPPTKGRKKGRRKKKNAVKTELTNGVEQKGPARVKSSKKKTSEAADTTKNTLVTDYFPVRRSDRRCKLELEKEKQEILESKILNGCEDGLLVEEISNKGRGVVATKLFQRGDFVVEYVGDLIDMDEAKHRDDKYSKDPSKGCYMYYFNFKNKKYCIDATSESGKLGRLLNHSKTNGNCHTKLVDVKGRPYLILVASRDIVKGEELQYDYGDRSKASLESHPWLKS